MHVRLPWLGLGCILMASLAADTPRIVSLDAAGRLTWTNSVEGTVAVIERADDLTSPSWQPFFYDWATNGLLSTVLPTNAASTSFYRIVVSTNAADPSLVMHLPFDNDLGSGTVLDVSGHNNHGFRYSSTNWPLPGRGPDGSQAGEFHRYTSTAGDYVAVPYASELDHLAHGTLLVWAYCTTESYGATALVDAGWWEDTNSWALGRNYATSMKFSVTTGSGEGKVVVTYPDAAADYDTGGWHHYGVTWDGTNFIGYFDGLVISTNTQSGFPELALGGSYKWIAIGCRSHDGTPLWGDDLYPNNGWMGGWIDDVRIYNRALTTAEVHAWYGSFDRISPSTPTNLTVRASSSSQIEVRWVPSTDNFRVEGYRIWRDGTLVGDAPGNLYVDSGLTPDTTYSYAVQAYDVGGSLSQLSSSVMVTTPPSDSGVELILDDADGEPWVSKLGGWRVSTGWPGYYGHAFLYDRKDTKGWSLMFRPRFPAAGEYAVYLRYPGTPSDTWQMSTAVPVDVVHAGQTNTLAVNQRQNYGTWFLLGQFPFDAGTNGYVRIRTEGTSGYFVLGDAVRFVK